YTYRREALYRARPAEALSPFAAGAMRRGEIDGVLFFSPRTAATFVTLMQGEGLAAAAQGMDAYCLSAAVAEAARPLTWRRVAIAERPDQPRLLDIIDSVGPGDGHGEH